MRARFDYGRFAAYAQRERGWVPFALRTHSREIPPFALSVAKRSRRAKAIAGLALALTAAAAPPDFRCPQGAEQVGAAPPDGFELSCERPGAPPAARREGPFRAWYDDGTPAKAARYREGRLDGPYEEWHRNGKLAREGAYDDGARTGRWRFYYESGRVEEEVSYERGDRHGPFTSYYPGGRRKAEGRYCRNLQCGTWTTWAEDGAVLGKVEYATVSDRP